MGTANSFCFEFDDPIENLKDLGNSFEEQLNDFYAEQIFEDWAGFAAERDAAKYKYKDYAEAPSKPFTESELFNRKTDNPFVDTLVISNAMGSYEQIVQLRSDFILEVIDTRPDYPAGNDIKKELIGGLGAASSLKELIEAIEKTKTFDVLSSPYEKRFPLKKPAEDLTEKLNQIFTNINTPPKTDEYGFHRAGGPTRSLCGIDPQDLFAELFQDALRKLAQPKLKQDLRDRVGFQTSTQPQFGVYNTTKGRLEKQAEKDAQQDIAKALAEQVTFQEQCFILANLGELVNHKKELSGSLSLPYVATTEIREDGSKESVLAGNAPINIQGSAFAFVNKLAVHPYTAKLFDLKEEELSSLTPRMRFFKVDSGDNGNDVETEITFDTKITENSLKDYLAKGGRGIGVGVNSFDFSYDGTDPFSAKKAISAKLSIYATSFSDLLAERTGTNGMKYSYVDLALKTGRNVSEKITLTEVEKLNIDKLNFRLKAVVEWVAEKKEMRMLRPEVKDAVYNSAISFYLTPTIHEFDFDETGAVNFTINYLAYIEDYFAQSQFDVFASTTADKQARDLVYDYYRQKGCDISTDEFSELREFDESYIAKTNVTALQSIVNSLRRNKNIYYISITKEEMREWLKFPTSNSYIKSITNVPTNSLEDDIVNDAATKAKTSSGEEKLDLGAYRLSLVANSDLRQNVALFYLSDLIAVVLKNIEDALIESESVFTSNYYEDVIKEMKEKGKIDTYIKDRLEKKRDPKFAATLKQFEKMRIVLGPMEVTPYGDLRKSTSSISCTLGDVPISLNYFLDFMSEKVLSKDFIKYPLSKFIKDIVNDCIKNFLNSNDCFRSGASQKMSLNSTTVLAYNSIDSGDADDDLSNLIISLKDTKASSKNCLLLNEVDKDHFPILKISGPKDSRTTLNINTMRNYYIFSVGRAYPTDLYAGNKSQDAEHGIFHYLLGANKGIVKNISLDKTNTPGLKELRFEQEGFDGLEQLREVYNANITTFLNPQTFPGTYIYVEPKGFDPKSTEDLTRFGIGGYYMIVKTSHSIKPGDAETTLNAAWVASKGGQVIKATKVGERDKRNVTEGSEKAKKCKVSSVFKTDIRGVS